jgi:hypothetical protein
MATRTGAHRRAADDDDSVLKDLLVRQLHDLYDADEQLVGAFAQLSRAIVGRRTGEARGETLP